ncbi:MAG: hypothetical protein ACTHOE_12850 [Conexibacter sp.]
MGTEIAPIGAAGFSAAPERAPRRSRAAAVEDTFTVSHGEIPASPPPEVLDAIGAAGRVARELHDTGRELRFTPPSAGEDGRVRVEVCDLDGNVLRAIPPSELLDVAAGAPLD